MSISIRSHRFGSSLNYVGKVIASTGDKLQSYDSWIDNFAEGIDDAADHAKALKASGLSEAMYDYIESTGVASVASMTFTQKLKLTTIAIKEQAAAFIASPFGKAVYSV